MDYKDKAVKKYNEALKNYYHYKDIYEDYYCGNNNNKISKTKITEIEFKMNQEYDILETLKFIFGEKFFLEHLE